MIRHLFFALVFALLVCRPVAAFAEKILDVQKLNTPGGIEVWLVQDRTVPVISMSFSFEGGLIYDPENLPGVGRLVSILLDEGAGKLDSQAFQSQLSDNAIQMGFTAGRDAFYGRLKTLTSNKTLAFSLLRMALNSPRFDSEAIERMRNANISQIKEDLGEPGWLVARNYNGMVFEGHSYAIPGFGTLDSMSRVTRQDLLNFIHAQFARDVLKVSIAGDITAEEAVKAVDIVFGALPEQAEKTEVHEALLNYPGKTILLPLDTPQTYISVGAGGIYRADRDWQAAVIMNYILGGSSFGSRLMHEIREKRGLTYGVYTSLSSMKYSALLQVNMSVSNNNVAESLKLLKEEWAKMAKNGPSEQEVEDAKSYLTGSLLLGLTSTHDISDTLNSLQRDGLDFNYINGRNAEIEGVTREDVKRVAERLLKPEELTTVLVGRPADVTADIMLDRPVGMKPVKEKK